MQVSRFDCCHSHQCVIRFVIIVAIGKFLANMELREGGRSYSQLSQGINRGHIHLGDNINSVVLSFAERSSSRRF